VVAALRGRGNDPLSPKNAIQKQEAATGGNGVLTARHLLNIESFRANQPLSPMSDRKK
jgi:hypothetical protein